MKYYVVIVTLILSSVLNTKAQTMKEGILYFKTGYYDNAIEILEQSSNSDDAEKDLIYYYIGLSEIGRKNHEKAQAALIRCLEDTKGTYKESLASGVLCILNTDIKGAESNFNKAIKQSDNSPLVILEAARAYLITDPTKYSTQITKYIDRARKNHTSGNLTISHSIDILNCDFNFAVGNEQAKVCPTPLEFDDFETLIKYIRHGRIAVAEKIIEKWLLSEDFSDMPDIVYQEFVSFFAREKKIQNALEHYMKWCVPTMEEPMKSKLYIFCVKLNIENNDYQKALELANEYLQGSPENEKMSKLQKQVSDCMK